MRFSFNLLWIVARFISYNFILEKLFTIHLTNKGRSSQKSGSATVASSLESQTNLSSARIEFVYLVYESIMGDGAPTSLNGTEGNTVMEHEELNLVQLRLHSKELLVFRWTLRFLSLWSPTTASLAERVFYPLFVNVLLLIVITLDIYVLVKVRQSWKSLEGYVFLAIDLGMYSSHLFGVAYFRSRDLEDNMIDLEVDLAFMEELRKKLRRLTIGIIISFLLLVATVLLFFNIETWTHGHFRCNSSFSFLHGDASHFVCMLNYPTNIYGVGNSLAISWTMCLFQQICCARLQQVADIYLRWNQSTEEAIYSHLKDYSRKVKETCSRLAKWFVAHNLILIIATPVVFADIIKEFKAAELYTLVYLLVFWSTLLSFGLRLCISRNYFKSTMKNFALQSMNFVQVRYTRSCNEGWRKKRIHFSIENGSEQVLILSTQPQNRLFDGKL